MTKILLRCRTKAIRRGKLQVAGARHRMEGGRIFMKRTRFPLVALVLCSSLAAHAQDNAASTNASPSPSVAPSAPAAATSAFTDEKDKLSYSIGVDIGRTLKKLQLDLNHTVLTQGISDVLGDKPTAMSDQDLQQTLQAFQQKMMAKQQADMAKKQEDMKGTAEKNKTDGKKFLEDNAKKAGVKTTASGLQYKVVTEGKGDKPKDTDVVETKYRGTTIDGKEFDSSEKNGGPVSFPVNGVIKGWTEALLLMPVGSKWQIYVPAELAYGDEGAGEDIAPGSTLIFDVELLSIKKDKGTAPAGTDTKPDAAGAAQKKGS
jgi:FKBP-type peptidyl-prolyl cis-trans isomerase